MQERKNKEALNVENMFKKKYQSINFNSDTHWRDVAASSPSTLYGKCLAEEARVFVGLHTQLLAEGSACADIFQSKQLGDLGYITHKSALEFITRVTCDWFNTLGRAGMNPENSTYPDTWYEDADKSFADNAKLKCYRSILDKLYRLRNSSKELRDCSVFEFITKVYNERLITEFVACDLCGLAEDI